MYEESTYSGYVRSETEKWGIKQRDILIQKVSTMAVYLQRSEILGREIRNQPIIVEQDWHGTRPNIRFQGFLVEDDRMHLHCTWSEAPWTKYFELPHTTPTGVQECWHHQGSGKPCQWWQLAVSYVWTTWRWFFCGNEFRACRMIIWIDCQVTGPYLPIYTKSQPVAQLAILSLLVIYSILKPFLRGTMYRNWSSILRWWWRA